MGYRRGRTDSGLAALAACALPLLLVQLAQHLKGDLNVVLGMPAWARGLAYTAMFYGVVVFGAHFGKPFIYFQF